MKKILVPCDFSEPASEAFKFAVRLASQSGGEIHVLHIIDLTFLHGNPSLSHSYAFNLNFLKDLEKEAEAKFQTLRQRFAPLTLPVKFRHQLGSLVQDIERYIREHAIDLVVMGTHGESKNLRGSNTQKVVQYSPVPVMAIRHEPKSVMANIVVPILPDQPDAHFYGELMKLQSFFKATIHFLWINTPGIFKSDPKAYDDLRRFARDAGFTNFTVQVRSDYDVEEGTYRFAREIDADLIAMRTHAWKGLPHFVVGSVAEDVVNHVNLPVWTCAAR